MTSPLPCFGCFLQLVAEKKTLKNGAAVTSIKPFLFRDDFRLGCHFLFLNCDDNKNGQQNLVFSTELQGDQMKRTKFENKHCRIC